MIAQNKRVCAMGIDPSVSGTGIVVLMGGEQKPTHVETLSSKLEGLNRTKDIVTRVMQTVESVDPTHIVIEGYSLNMKNASSVVPLVELGGIMRLMLMLDGKGWYDPRAGELKKFVTGSGTAPKDKVMMMVHVKFGYMSENNNIADAYALAAMGLAYEGFLPKATKEMAQIAKKMIFRKF